MHKIAGILLAGFMVFAPVAPTAFGAGHETSSIGAREALEQLIASDHRSEEHKARDGYRHPYETLTFFGIEPGMTVVEIWPGGQGSWYREIIEPFITAGGGAYIPVTEDHDFLMSEEGLPYGEADMVLVFRAHGFMISDKPAQRYVDALFAMLKPGGIFGIVDHAGDEAIPQDPEGVNGYVNESHFKILAEAAGFILLADADINRNPADTKDHPRGVWSLPPTLSRTAPGTPEQQKYLEIGESDRFTLKFYKPE
ncbi:MAG: class I SAM-dependent methyltransferase [Proteobacteria bacterium]|nr:class I SAM-dependent methyltransferase [Pseudomonadota bacterium]